MGPLGNLAAAALTLGANMGNMLMGERDADRHSPFNFHQNWKRSQSGESKFFHRKRAEDKRKRKAAINRARVERGEMRAIGERRYFAIDTATAEPDYMSTPIQFLDNMTSTIGDDEIMSVETIGDKIKDARAELDALPEITLPPGVVAGPLLGQVTITDPDLWERIKADPRVKVQNQRKKSLMAEQFTLFVAGE